MTDPTTPNTNAPGGGTQPAGGDSTPGQQTPKTFTQDQVDAIVAERLTRERGKFADYDTLKGRAAKWQEHEDAQKSEMEKLADSIKAAQAERDDAISRANDLLIRSAFIAAGAASNLVNPADAYALADLSNVTIGDDGKVTGVEDAVKVLVEGGRLPVKGRTTAPSTNGGAGAPQRPGQGEPPLSAEELEVARRMGIKPEEYAKYKSKT